MAHPVNMNSNRIGLFKTKQKDPKKQENTHIKPVPTNGRH